ncbi:SAM domain and HD [Geranomyces michiganensis]|nr:SAM domain and HD [Geranomyces michiganensis]
MQAIPPPTTTLMLLRAAAAAAAAAAAPVATRHRYVHSKAVSPTGTTGADTAKRLHALIMGSPGAGKGTQTKRIAQRFAIETVSSGDLLRQSIMDGTPYGLQAQKIIEDGGLVPDNLVVELIMFELDKLNGKNWMLDGFPRTRAQAETLETHLETLGHPLDLVINLDVPEEVILQRIIDRWVHPASGRTYNLSYNPPIKPGVDDETGEPLEKRLDDNVETFKYRLDQYHEQTKPLLEFYTSHGKLHNFRGATNDFGCSPLSSQEAAPVSYSKTINDPIHGHIKLDEYCMQVVDTVQFQRLRDLKQLGSAYFVFPGAAHNRFEHSIGVCHLAGVLVEHFRTTQPELGITDNDVKCVKLAGLCHDLGHGPFSHIFDNEFMKQARPGLEWTHEQASEAMLQYLCDDNPHVNINAEELRFIKDLIRGEPRSEYPQAEKRFLFEIVANKRNSVDVDKFDYIQRDCHNVGIKTSLDALRLMTFSRVIDNQICFYKNEVFNLYEMFHTRYRLFKTIYTHKVGKATEYMVTEALLAADKYLGISSSVDDMTRYVHITDAIIKEIERSSAPELAKSRHIIERIRTRDLYRFVDAVPVELSTAATVRAAITPEAVVAYQESGDGLTENDVVVEWLKLGYAMKDQNPVDLIQFYRKWHPNISFGIARENVSALIPPLFEEITLRIFARDNQKRQKIQRAFRKLYRDLQQSELFVHGAALGNLSSSEICPNGDEGIKAEGGGGRGGSIDADSDPDQNIAATPVGTPSRPRPARRLFGEDAQAAGTRVTDVESTPVSSSSSLKRPNSNSCGRGAIPPYATPSPLRPHHNHTLLQPCDSTLLPLNYTDMTSPARKRPRVENGNGTGDGGSGGGGGGGGNGSAASVGLPQFQV